MFHKQMSTFHYNVMLVINIPKFPYTFRCRLVVAYNNIGNKGLCALADCMKVNISIIHHSLHCRLVVAYNNIGNKGLCALADCMKVNTTLTKIFIWGNKLEEPATIVCINFMSLNMHIISKFSTQNIFFLCHFPIIYVQN